MVAVVQSPVQKSRCTAFFGQQRASECTGSASKMLITRQLTCEKIACSLFENGWIVVPFTFSIASRW